MIVNKAKITEMAVLATNCIPLSSMNSEMMNELGLDEEKITRLKWQALSKRVHIELTEFIKNKNIVNALRVIKQDIFYLVNKYAYKEVFNDASYNRYRKCIQLGFNNIMELIQRIDSRGISDISDEENIYTLVLAISTFTAIYNTKRLNLHISLEEFYIRRYQNNVLKANTIKTNEERSAYIKSLIPVEDRIVLNKQEKPKTIEEKHKDMVREAIAEVQRIEREQDKADEENADKQDEEDTQDSSSWVGIEPPFVDDIDDKDECLTEAEIKKRNELQAKVNKLSMSLSKLNRSVK
jgi:hypothetical protein